MLMSSLERTILAKILDVAQMRMSDQRTALDAFKKITDGMIWAAVRDSGDPPPLEDAEVPLSADERTLCASVIGLAERSASMLLTGQAGRCLLELGDRMSSEV